MAFSSPKLRNFAPDAKISFALSGQIYQVLRDAFSRLQGRLKSCLTKTKKNAVKNWIVMHKTTIMPVFAQTRPVSTY